MNDLNLAISNVDQSQQQNDSIDYFSQQLEAARDAGDRIRITRALGDLANAYSAFELYPQAFPLYEEQLELAREINERAMEASALRGLGEAYYNLGKYRQAVSLYEQQLAITREISDPIFEMQALTALAYSHNALRQFKEAIDYYEQQLVIIQEIDFPAGKGIILSNIGLLFLQDGQSELATIFLKESVNVWEEVRQRIDDEELIQSYTNTISDTYRNLASLLLEQDRLLEAEQVLDLLKIQEIKQYTRGQVLAPTSRLVFLSPAEQDIYRKYESIIGFAKEVAACRQASDCFGSDRMQILQADRRALTAEFDQAVQEFAAEIQRRIGGGEPLIAINTLTGAGQDIVNAQPDTVLIYPVVLDDSLWLMWVTEAGVPNAIKVNDIGKAEIDKAVLKFRLLMRKCEDNSLYCQSETGIQAIQTVSQQLYTWLMPDLLETELRENGIQNLVFSLDQSIRYIPIAALFDGDRYLAESYTISTVNSASLTNRDRPLPDRPNETSVLALGLSDPVPANPDIGIPSFRALDNVPAEINAIVKQNGADEGVYQGTEQLNAEFDESAILQAPGHQILHIATHGLFDPTSLVSSFLVLGTQEPWRISDINLDRQLFSDISLVVLSACETGLAQNDWAANPGENVELSDGREVSSIAQAFITAGANTVIASLWQVSDAATSEVMQSFYGSLAQNTADTPVTIAQAMQTAQLQMLYGSTDADFGPNRSTEQDATIDVQTTASSASSRYAHPYYWSPFVIIGNGL